MRSREILGLVLLLCQLIAVCNGSNIVQLSDKYDYTKHFHGKRVHSSAVIKHVTSRSYLHCCTLCHDSDGCRGVAYNDMDCWLIGKTQTSCIFIEECKSCDYKVLMRYLKLDVVGSGTDCKSLLEQGYTEDGVYTLSPSGSTPFQAFCDMTSGGWTVFQRRVDDSVDFRRGWEDYVAGFGVVCENFWAGLDNIHTITQSQDTELLVNMDTFEGESAEAHYSSFYVGDAASGYMVTVSGHSGTAGDSMTYHNQQRFTTFDNDQDARPGDNCAVEFSGGWWYKTCFYCNPNGLYLHGGSNQGAKGVIWSHFNAYDSLKTIELKVRRMN